MSASLHPTEGARLLLERRAVTPDLSTARYRASVITPDRRFDYDALLRMDGSAELTAIGAPAPREWEERLAMHARQVARGVERRRADQRPPWPNRLLRWRAP